MNNTKLHIAENLKTSGHNSIGQCIHFHLKKFFDMHQDGTAPSDLYNNIMQEVEKALITETMKYSDNVQAKATKILGINRNTLSKKIKQYSIK